MISILLIFLFYQVCVFFSVNGRIIPTELPFILFDIVNDNYFFELLNS